MEMLTDAARLRMFDLGFGVINIVGGKEELMAMFIWSATKLAPPAGHNAQYRHFVLFNKRQNLVAEKISSHDRCFGRVQLGMCHLAAGVDKC